MPLDVTQEKRNLLNVYVHDVNRNSQIPWQILSAPSLGRSGFDVINY